MQHAKSLAVCVVLVVAAYLVGRSTLEAQQPVPTLDRQFTPGTVFADARTPISTLPFTIDRCGSYFLTACLTGVAGANGITVNSDDVTIDLNGFTLVGVSGTADGIHVPSSAQNTLIHNGSITGWGGFGIYTGRIAVPSSVKTRVSNVFAYANGSGGFSTGSESLLRDCIAADNSGFGFEVLSASQLVNCISRENTGGGFQVTSNAFLTECYAQNSPNGVGFLSIGGGGAFLARCHSASTSIGFWGQGSFPMSTADCASHRDTQASAGMVATCATGLCVY